MSKPIKITDEFKMAALREFAEALSRMRMTDGKITYTKPLDNFTRRATVSFTQEAWMKMVTLVMNFDKEVAWHGIAQRSEDPDKDEYIISDILVYPQKVTASTVETDQEEYETWLYALPDEVFNKVRMQGHSHVNMSTYPSGVDTTHQGKIMAQLDDDMFYIFMIWNKRLEKWIKIYDFAKNTMFENTDVDVKIINDAWGMDEFLKNAKDLVKSSYPAQGSSSGGSGYYGGIYNGSYNGSYNGGYSSLDKKSTAPEKTATAPAQLPAKTEPEDKAVPEKKTNDGENDGGEKRGSTSR